MSKDCPDDDCDGELDPDFPYGGDVRCPACGMWWKTEAEYSWDSMYWWLTGELADEQWEEEETVDGGG